MMEPMAMNGICVKVTQKQKSGNMLKTDVSQGTLCQNAHLSIQFLSQLKNIARWKFRGVSNDITISTTIVGRAWFGEDDLATDLKSSSLREDP